VLFVCTVLTDSPPLWLTAHCAEVTMRSRDANRTAAGAPAPEAECSCNGPDCSACQAKAQAATERSDMLKALAMAVGTALLVRRLEYLSAIALVAVGLTVVLFVCGGGDPRTQPRGSALATTLCVYTPALVLGLAVRIAWLILTHTDAGDVPSSAPAAAAVGTRRPPPVLLM
jgi:hypothetical protein